jgi:rhodanese-related sulfurtransferase
LRAADYTTVKTDVARFLMEIAATRAHGAFAARVASGAGGRSLVSPAMDYTPQQLAERLAREQIQLIDVRAPHEHEAGRIAGDRLIELGELGARAQSIDRDRPVVFYCRSGGRSAMATEAFRQAGYDAHNMEGGLLAWQAAGLPLDPPGGHVAD